MSRAVRRPTFRANLNAEVSKDEYNLLNNINVIYIDIYLQFVPNSPLLSHYVQVIRYIDQYMANEAPNYKFPESNDQLRPALDIDDECEVFGEKSIKKNKEGN